MIISRGEIQALMSMAFWLGRVQVASEVMIVIANLDKRDGQSQTPELTRDDDASLSADSSED